MKPTTFNNALVATVSAYAEVLQELTAENAQLKDSLRMLKQMNAVPDGEMLVPKKHYARLKEALISSGGEGYSERVETEARELIFATENP